MFQNPLAFTRRLYTPVNVSISQYCYPKCVSQDITYTYLQKIYFIVSASEFIRSEKGTICQTNVSEVLKAFRVASDTNIFSAETARNVCEKYCANKQSCWGCSVFCKGWKRKHCQWNAVENCMSQISWIGWIQGDVTAKPG